MPNTYHSTTSVFSIRLSAEVQTDRPESRSLWTGKSPHGQRSSWWYGVTHKVCPITAARWKAGEAGSSSGGNAAEGTSLYPTGVPSAFKTPEFTTVQPRCVPQS